MTSEAPPFTITKHLLLVVNVIILVPKPMISVAIDGKPNLTAQITNASIGGMPNLTAQITNASIGGKPNLTAQITNATIVGKPNLTAQITNATIGGKSNLTAHITNATIGGKSNLTAQITNATIGVKPNVTVQTTAATIGGMPNLTAQITKATIGGKPNLTVQTTEATIGGKPNLTVQTTEATIGGKPNLTVQITEDCSPKVGVQFVVSVTGLSTNKWPARVTVDEYEGQLLKQVCQVGYSNGVCANNDMCQCVGASNNNTQFTFSMQYIKKNDTTKFRVAIFDSDEKEKVEEKFELPGSPKIRITMDNSTDLLDMSEECKLNLFYGTRHTFTICHEGILRASLHIGKYDRGVASAFRKPCVHYQFEVSNALDKYKFFYSGQCMNSSKLKCDVFGFDPDNITIPSCEFCETPSMVDWLVLMKWLLPSTVLSTISCSLIIFYVRAPADEFQYYVEKSFGSMKSLSRSQSTKSIKSVKKSHEKITGLDTPKKTATVQSMAVPSKVPVHEDPQPVAFGGSLIL